MDQQMRKTIRMCCDARISTSWPRVAASLVFNEVRAASPRIACSAISPSYREGQRENAKCSSFLPMAGEKNGGSGNQWRLGQGGHCSRRQFQNNTRAAVGQIGCLDFTTVLLHDAIADAEAEPGSLAHGLGGVKGIEDAVWIAKARAIIVKVQQNTISVPQRFNADHFPGPSFQRVNGVVEQVEQNLLELIFVESDWRKIRLYLYLQLHIMVADVILTKRQNVLQQDLEIGRFLFQVILAGETQQVFNNAPHALGLANHLFQLLPGRTFFDVIRHQFGIAHNRRQGVIQLMCNACNKLADG